MRDDDGNSDVSWLMKKQMQIMSQQYLADLPEFDGDADMWPIFYQQFISTSEQGCFDDSFNLMRLRKALKGEARQAVMGILALPDCLNDVMAILEKRFGNLDMIVKRKIKKLSTLAPPIENKPQTIKVFYEFVLGLHATLKNARAANYLQSPQTLDSIVDKLPANMVRQWLRHKRNLDNGATIDNFIEWFEPFYDCANECEIVKAEQQKRSDSRVNLHNETSQKQSMKSTDESRCLFCKKSKHNLDDVMVSKNYRLVKNGILSATDDYVSSV